ncbi:hypothetical protein ABFS83_04G207900 [Erythranthe nasuta]
MFLVVAITFGFLIRVCAAKWRKQTRCLPFSWLRSNVLPCLVYMSHQRLGGGPRHQSCRTWKKNDTSS